MIKVKSGSNSSILSVGTYRAKNLIPNSAIVEQIESSDEWIQQRTGIESRRFADKEVTVVDMGVAAAKEALNRANINADKIDTIILATITYPHQTPSGASGIAAAIGANKAAVDNALAANNVEYTWELSDKVLEQARTYAQQMLELKQIRALPDFAKFLNPTFSKAVAAS